MVTAALGLAVILFGLAGIACPDKIARFDEQPDAIDRSGRGGLLNRLTGTPRSRESSASK
ncbi:hypothetical protein ACNS7O_06355 [Haloferacaceae archaeon DSL9]